MEAEGGKGVRMEPMKGLQRAAVVEMLKESKNRRVYNWLEFP